MKSSVSQKEIFKTLFLLLTVLLLILPFLVSFNEVLTKLVEKFALYVWVEKKIVPLQVGMVQTLTRPFGIGMHAYANGMLVKGRFLAITWNCIGWQSLLLFTITMVVGLRNAVYTLGSKTVAIVIGLLGTFLINLLRLVLIVLIYYYLEPIYFYIYHDYLAALVTIIWLFFFWWFSYRYVLEDKSV